MKLKRIFQVFAIGDSVMAHSLKNAAELNGKHGRITAFVKDRVSILFDDGDRVNIKPANLKTIVRVFFPKEWIPSCVHLGSNYIGSIPEDNFLFHWVALDFKESPPQKVPKIPKLTVASSVQSMSDVQLQQSESPSQLEREASPTPAIRRELLAFTEYPGVHHS